MTTDATAATLVYSSTTGDLTPFVLFSDEDLAAESLGREHAAQDRENAIQDWMSEPHCFVCNRHTDHFAEHDELVAEGMAYYTTDGSVHRTDTYTDEEAFEVAHAAYLNYLAERDLQSMDEDI